MSANFKKFPWPPISALVKGPHHTYSCTLQKSRKSSLKNYFQLYKVIVLKASLDPSKLNTLFLFQVLLTNFEVDLEQKSTVRFDGYVINEATGLWHSFVNWLNCHVFCVLEQCFPKWDGGRYVGGPRSFSWILGVLGLFKKIKRKTINPLHPNIFITYPHTFWWIFRIFCLSFSDV